MAIRVASTLLLVFSVGIGCAASSVSLPGSSEDVRTDSDALTPAEDGVVPGMPPPVPVFHRSHSHIWDLHAYLDEVRRRSAQSETPCVLVLVPVANPVTGKTEKIPVIVCS